MMKGMITSFVMIMALATSYSSAAYDPALQQFTAPIGHDGIEFDEADFGFDELEPLYGTEISEDILLEIDEETAGVMVIGSVGTPIAAGLAWDEASGLLFATDTNTGNLVTIDPGDGSTTIVGNMGIGITHSAAIDPATGTLYVVGLEGVYLFVVDKGSGAATPIGGLGGNYHVSGLDFDPTSGILYGAFASHQEFGYLVTIDPSTGQATFVADTHRINGMSFDSDGNLYAVENGMSSQVPSSLYHVDKHTGAWDLIGEMPADNVLGLVFQSDLVPTAIGSTTWSGIKVSY